MNYLGNFLDVMHGTNAVKLRSITLRLWKKIFQEGENVKTLSLSETVPGVSHEKQVGNSSVSG